MILNIELSQPSNSGDSQPSTTNSSRASSAQISGHLHREKQGRTLSAKRHSSAGSNLSQFGPSKTPRAVSRKGCWTAVGTNDIRPALTASLFPNVTSTIHFTVEGERGIVGTHSKVRISASQIANCKAILEIVKICEAIFLRIAKVITLRCKTLHYVVSRYATL